MVALPEGLSTQAQDMDTVDVLTQCLSRVLSELGADDREALTLCDRTDVMPTSNPSREPAHRARSVWFWPLAMTVAAVCLGFGLCA